MSGILSPIHVGMVGAAKLRFFAPPGDLPEFPWFAIEDLCRCMALSREHRRVLFSQLEASPWRGDIKRAQTNEGPATLAPHFIAQGLIDALSEAGRTPATIYAQYAHQGAVALKTITASMPPDKLLAYLAAATRDDNDVGGDR